MGDCFSFQTMDLSCDYAYTNAKLTPKQRYFNYRLSRARMVTKGAYGQLKGRWRVLLRKCDSCPDEVKVVTLSCMILHNICISQGDVMPKTLDISIDPETLRRRDSSEIRNILHMTESQKGHDNDYGACQIRDRLADSFWQEKEAIDNEGQ